MYKPTASDEGYRLRESFIAQYPERRDWWVAQYGRITEILADILGERIPQINETIRDSTGKRYIVVRRQGANVIAVANSGGGDRGSVFADNWVQARGPKILRIRPLWSSKQAKERYKDYVNLMTKAGNAALIVPFEFHPELRPDEDPEGTPASDANPDVTIRHTSQDGTVALYPKNAEITQVIRKFGFVWAPTASVMRRTNTVGVAKTPVNLGTLKAALNQAGFRVAFDIAEAVSPEEVAAAHERRRAYLRGRAAMIADRGQRAAQRAAAYAQRAGIGAKEALTKLEIEGYYPTPQELVTRVIDAADIEPGDNVLEPSAGSGTLADAASAAGGEVDAVEVNPRLGAYLRSLGYPVVATNILDFAPGGIYDVVVMNPPFERGQDIDHVRHAARLLKPGGRLVAIVSAGAVQRSDRKAQAFREWLESQGATIEMLPATTFGRATVSTALVTLDVPEGAETAPRDDAQIAAIARARAEAEGATGDASAIAADLIERASTSRRAQRSLERAKRLSKEEAEYAEALARRARSIEATARQVGVEKPKATGSGWQPGDRVAVRPVRWGEAVFPAIVVRAFTDKVKVRNLETGVESAYRAQLLEPLSWAVTRGDVDAKYLTVEIGKTKRWDEALDDELRKIAKKEFGATLFRSDTNGYAIGFGPVRETYAGKRAAVVRRIRYERTKDGRNYAEAYRSFSLLDRPAVVLDVTGMTPTDAARAFAAQIVALGTEAPA
jgi:protein-L-isoaspartate O-methyltransferase